jgi:hypothetical protein
MSSSISVGKVIDLEIVVVSSGSLSWYKFNEIFISGISHPFRSIYILKVDSIHAAKEARSVEKDLGQGLFLQYSWVHPYKLAVLK